MEKRSYHRLSAQDQSFLLMESPTTPMHVSSTQIFEAGSLRTPEGGIDVETYKKAVAAVLHLVPRYRQRLEWIPMENRAVWVDDPHFNLDYHIRHSALPRPGTEEQLKRLSARIMAQQLDRSRPLWEIWVVEGLEGGRFATVNKIHHCMIDGLAGVDLAYSLFSTTPRYEIQEAPRYVPHTAPAGLDLLRDSLRRRLRLPLEIIRGVRDFRRETESLRQDLAIRARAIADLIGTTAQAASETPLNQPLGPHRRFDYLALPLAHFKAVSKAFECTLNDVVLATVAGAMREFLMARRVHPEDMEFRVAAPVSVRTKEERGGMGNRVSNWFIPLPIGEANPRQRLETIQKLTQKLKTSQQALGVQMMMAVAEWTPTVVLSTAMRGASAASNMIVTNVPGPQDTLYLLGAKLLYMFPGVPLLENQGLGIALVSYAGTLCWGFNADYELVPDLAKFVKLIERSFNELAAVAGVDRTRAPREAAPPAMVALRSSTSGRHEKRKQKGAAQVKAAAKTRGRAAGDRHAAGPPKASADEKSRA